MPCGCSNVCTKKVAIGPWDMQTDSSISVAHGVDFATLHMAGVSIVNDAGDTKYCTLINDGGVIPIDIEMIDSTNVYIRRKSGGIFDAVGFSSTGINRGYVIIFYGGV